MVSAHDKAFFKSCSEVGVQSDCHGDVSEWADTHQCQLICTNWIILVKKYMYLTYNGAGI